MMSSSRNWRSFDYVLVFTALALLGLGLALIYSGSLSTYHSGAAILRGPIAKQVAFAVAGVALMLGLARLDYRNWSGFALPLYVLSVVALAGVLVLGQHIFGSRRWIQFAGMQLQPSEVAKLVTIVLLARYLSENEDRLNRLKPILISLGMAAVPAMLVFDEPDLGTAVVFLAVWLGMVFVAGARLRHLLTIAGAVVVAIPFLMLVALTGYQRERLAIFVNPARDPFGTGYNILQAQIGIGSGGWFGKGLTHGTQTQYAYLRTQTTDYVFSVLGEELGFVGCMVLFCLFIVLLMRGLRVAALAPDSFGRLIATGIAIMILFQVFINVGVNIRLFPVTGIPLPLISQGGSSLLMLFGALGLLQSILLRRRMTGVSTSEYTLADRNVSRA